uniref:uncharacterized protein LOC117162856 isoform X1 n=2 Tax=Bombus vancouverensis nearcticus TaxID=2705178 RepID=UPI00143C78DC|nr:uncharacterized protein LOC117162856 isoform X1 [Bombus vancouverensis nearcticus]XP_033200741.1 uncharacterized protein LOC117162861 isoform X1 [Bombus vancouverensis nearcticus]XP_033204425.1 uncharacterized protein LOC117165074 isoform X1 [Bombus vancouverensis nearcticus]
MFNKAIVVHTGLLTAVKEIRFLMSQDVLYQSVTIEHCDRVARILCLAPFFGESTKNVAVYAPLRTGSTLTEIIEVALATTTYQPNNRQTKIIPQDFLDKIRGKKIHFLRTRIPTISYGKPRTK